jgi:branched-subunit amino acid ABC-type transport system permease component
MDINIQLLINIVFLLNIYLIFSVSFHLIFKPTKIFHIAHAFTITLGAYLTYLFYHLLELNLILSLIIALTFTTLYGIANEMLFYKHLRGKKESNLKMLILSLGVYIVSQNLISLFFGDDIKSLSKGEVKVGHEFMGAYITDIQIITIAVALAILVVTLYLWHKTKFGFAIRAIADNPELSQVFGIPKDRVILLAFALGSLYAGIGGILVGFDTGITPTFGFSLLLYAIVVMIIGGVENLWGIVIGAFILATVQNLTAYYIDTKWMDAITYGILILFLMVRPYGVSGVKNRKVEV